MAFLARAAAGHRCRLSAARRARSRETGLRCVGINRYVRMDFCVCTYVYHCLVIYLCLCGGIYVCNVSFERSIISYSCLVTEILVDLFIE